MTRLLLLFTVLLVLVALGGVILSGVMRVARDGQMMVQQSRLFGTGRGELQKVGYLALILLMLGVTSGLIGGL